MTAPAVASAYMIDGIFFVFGTFFVAVAIEKWNVHKRFALLSLRLVGTKPSHILLCFMAMSFVLSMWMSNTATASMIIPIARALALEMKKQRLAKENKKKGYELGTLSTETLVNGSDEIEELESRNGDNNSIQPEQDTSSLMENDKFDDTTTAFQLGVVYCSLMGGAATLIGTPQTIIMKIHLDRTYGPQVMSFGSWFLVGFPCQVISILIGWVWLQWLFLDLSFRKLFQSSKCCKKARKSSSKKNECVKEYIRGELKTLGPVSWGEWSIICIFILAILAWFTSDPGIFPGWLSLDKTRYISITQSSILIAILLFILPANPREAYNRFAKDVSKKLEWRRLMDIKTARTEYPWMTLFLTFGSGLAMGDACQVSGLSAWIAEKLINLNHLDPWIVALILIVGVSLACEGLGNVMVIIVALPIISELAHSMEVNPLYFIIPSTLAATFAFMLPISSGPSIVAYAYGNLRIVDMMKAGFLMNIICIFINNVCIHTLCVWIFDIYTYPDWAPRTSVTTTPPGTIDYDYNVTNLP
ncbi:solute carrier family 13 member 1-like isoform X3 [Glandiceps talaboti]